MLGLTLLSATSSPWLLLRLKYTAGDRARVSFPQRRRILHLQPRKKDDESNENHLRFDERAVRSRNGDNGATTPLPGISVMSNV